MSEVEGTPTHVVALELEEGPPPAVEAGGDLRVVVRARCAHGCDLDAARLSVEGPGASGVTEAALAPAEGGHAHDAQLVLTAPAEVGPARWQLCLTERRIGGVVHVSVPLWVTTVVEPHRTSLAIWNVPSPIRGTRFSVRVGVKCSSRCSLGGQRVELGADSGQWLADGLLEGKARPNSDGLYEAEVSLVAPAEAGVFFRRVRFEGSGLSLPHEPAEATFSFRAVPHPDCTVTVHVAPNARVGSIGGVEVRVGPYATQTDELGVARVEVARGAHRLSLWRIDIEPVHVELDVSEDAEVTLGVMPRRRVDADADREWM